MRVARVPVCALRCMLEQLQLFCGKMKWKPDKWQLRSRCNWKLWKPNLFALLRKKKISMRSTGTGLIRYGGSLCVLKRSIYLNTQKITLQITLTNSNYQLGNNLLTSTGRGGHKCVFILTLILCCVWITQTIRAGKCALGLCVCVCIWACWNKSVRWRVDGINRRLWRCSCFAFCMCCTFTYLITSKHSGSALSTQMS